MDTSNMEYHTAVKDCEQIVLEYGYDEIMRSQKQKGCDNDIIDQTKNQFQDWVRDLKYSGVMET